MKNNFSNSELVHIWANQTQQTGKGSNMFFEGAKIYSYGHHFTIANIIKPGIVLFTTKGYSKTTSKHKSFVSRALRGQTVFNVPEVDFNLSYKIDSLNAHQRNLQYYKNQISDCLDKAIKSTENSDWLVSQSKMYLSQGLDYCQTFKLGKRQSKFFNTPLVISEELKNRIEKQVLKVQIENEQREQRERVKNSEIYNLVLPLWFNHDKPNSDVCNYSVYELKESYLRLSIDGVNVETSHGAKVSLRAAKILFEMIKKGNDIKGHSIDGYIVISLNGVLTIGCHKIERAEINRFAGLMGWGSIDLH